MQIVMWGFFLRINEKEEWDVNKLDFRDPLQCAKSCFIFWRKLLLQMQKEHFTTKFFSKHSSGHKNLAEQMQDHNKLGTETWGALHQMRAGFSDCDKVLDRAVRILIAFPHYDSICPVLVAFSTSLSVPDLPFPNEAEGKAPLFSNSLARPTKPLYCTLLWKPRAVTSVQRDIWIWPLNLSFQQIIYMVHLFVSSSHVYIVPRSF